MATPLPSFLLRKMNIATAGILLGAIALSTVV